jgi:hypothetical protein
MSRSPTKGLFDVSESEKHRQSLNVEINYTSEEQTCTKNPGHVDFIPIQALNIASFPGRYQDEDLLQTVKLLGDLTVKVKVLSAKTKTGSGKVIDISKNTLNGTCPCSKCCKEVDKPNKTWWEIVVLTSSLVVANNEEAKNSKCSLFYDNADCPYVDIDGLKTVRSSEKSDICRLICVTCDGDLAQSLEMKLERFTNLYETTFDKFWEVKNPEKLVVIVSHPHGAHKKVSIGKILEKNTFSDGYSSISYSTNTCPGSTGAFLYIL